MVTGSCCPGPDRWTRTPSFRNTSSSSSSLGFNGGWQTSLTVHYRHKLDWSVEREIKQEINEINKNKKTKKQTKANIN